MLRKAIVATAVPLAANTMRNARTKQSDKKESAPAPSHPAIRRVAKHVLTAATDELIDRLLENAKYAILKKLRDHLREHIKSSLADNFYDLIRENRLMTFLDKHPLLKNLFEQKVEACIDAFCDELSSRLSSAASKQISRVVEKQFAPKVVTPEPKAQARSFAAPAAQSNSEIINSALYAIKSAQLESDRLKLLQKTYGQNNSSLSDLCAQSGQHYITQYVKTILNLAPQNTAFICNILDTANLDTRIVQSFVNTSGLKAQVRSYCLDLPNTPENLLFLNRCVDKKTSLGQFCWRKAERLGLFSQPNKKMEADNHPETSTVIEIRRLIKNIRSELTSLEQNKQDQGTDKLSFSDLSSDLSSDSSAEKDEQSATPVNQIRPNQSTTRHTLQHINDTANQIAHETTSNGQTHYHLALRVLALCLALYCFERWFSNMSLVDHKPSDPGMRP